MSKPLVLGISFLVLILIALAGLSFYTLTQKQSLENQLTSTQNDLSKAQNELNELNNKASKLQEDNDKLSKQIESKSREANQAKSDLTEAQRHADEIQAQLDQISRERDDWKGRIETIRRERDEIVEKMKEMSEHKAKEEKVEEKTQEEVAQAPSVTSDQGDDYWASILKQKAALQIELEKVKADLDQSALQVVELKKQNSDLQMQLKYIKDEKEDIERKIKYGEDLANNLSVELARARNDQKFTNDRADKLKEQNLQLQDQIRQLMTTKVALERTVAHLNSDKANMQKKLSDTEGVIQGRINEIWQIKETLDQKLSNIPAAAKADAPRAVELSPIIVNSQNAPAAPAQVQQVAPAAQAAPTQTVNTSEGQASKSKVQGSVLSINEANNFVICDFGQENSSIRVGQVLKVYRKDNEVATLEVIQVRRDISAADIKNKNGEIKTGDTVRFLN